METIHYNILKWCTNLSLCLTPSAADAAVDKECEKLEKILAWNLTKVRRKKKGDRWSKDEGRKSSFRLNWWTYVIWKMMSWRQSTKNTEGRVVFRGDIVKDDSGSYAVFIHRTRIINITNDSGKSHGYHFQTAKLCRTSSGRSICFYPAKKWRIFPNYSKFQNRNVQTFGFVYHDTNGHNHSPVWKTQLFLLKGICTVILWQDWYGKGNLRTSYCSTVGRRFPIRNAYSYTANKGYSYLWMWMTSNWVERSRSGRTNIFPRSCILGVHSTTMREISKDIVDNYRAMLNHEFPRVEKRNYHSLKFFVSLHGSMIWKGMQRSVWNNIVS